MNRYFIHSWRPLDFTQESFAALREIPTIGLRVRRVKPFFRESEQLMSVTQ